MKRFLLMILMTVLICLIGFPSGAAFAATDDTILQQQDEDYFNLPLCLPGMQSDGTCLLYGPSRIAAEMKAAGFPYPPRELPAAYLPADYGVMPVLIAKINLSEYEPAPIYGSFEDARAAVNPIYFIEAGRMRFVSYIDRRDDTNGAHYVQLASGGWTRAAPAAIPNFQGLKFYENPKNNFGWMISEDESYVAPSFNAKNTGVVYKTHTVFQVYDTVEAEGYLWYQVAPDEWINSHVSGVVILRQDPPEGVTANRWIELDLFQQTIMAYEDGQLLFATLATTGWEPFYTKPGVFTIYEKKELADMLGSFEADRSDYYLFQDVPWQMYYDEARAIHTAYWRTNFGYEGSHGCVNLSPGDAHWMFLWANEGDYVWVHDTSGRTPTDPNYYGPGAP